MVRPAKRPALRVSSPCESVSTKSIAPPIWAPSCFEKVNVPVLGIVENMSYLECPECDHRIALFGEGGGAQLASEVGLPLLAQMPLDPRIVAGGDAGRPIVVEHPESVAAKIFQTLANQVAAFAASAATHAG